MTWALFSVMFYWFSTHTFSGHIPSIFRQNHSFCELFLVQQLHLHQTDSDTPQMVRHVFLGADQLLWGRKILFHIQDICLKIFIKQWQFFVSMKIIFFTFALLGDWLNHGQFFLNCHVGQNIFKESLAKGFVLQKKPPILNDQPRIDYDFIILSKRLQ